MTGEIKSNELEIDHLFRHNSGQMVAVLVRTFGISYIDDIEDAVQDSLVKALKLWPINGVPEKPLPWLIQVSKNSILDKIRRDVKLVESEESDTAAAEQSDVYFENELNEDQLKMIFACCHPAISSDSQIAITLKTVGGFNNREIASAFLSKKTAIDKLITRAKSQLKKQRQSFVIPSPDKLPDRLDSVLKVIYLIFNEGYMASGGSEVLRRDLCFEAIRLAQLLEKHPRTALPKTSALLALLYFQASRLENRTDDHGLPVLLPDQDRKAWDRKLIVLGLQQLQASAKGNELSTYHIEAEIASLHAVAQTYEETNWKRIVECYELLEMRTGSSVVHLNKLFAKSRLGNVADVFEELMEIEPGEYDSLYQYHLVRAELEKELGMSLQARKSYQNVIGLTRNEAIKDFVSQRILQL